MRRWLLWIVLVLVLLTVGGVIAVQVALRTDIPRQLVVEALRDATGLNVNAASLDTRWAGQTVIRDLSVALPLEQDPFLTSDELAIDHTSLIRLVLTRRLSIDSAEIRRPDLTIKPDEHGEWNVLRAAEIITQRQRQRQPDLQVDDALPRLRITEAIVHIAGPDGMLYTYDPITVEGDPIDAVAWAFNVDYAPAVRVAGRIAPRAGWQHEVAFELEDVRRLIEPWLPEAPDQLAAKGSWRGQVIDAALRGSLTVDELRADRFEVSGESGVELIEDRLVLRPKIRVRDTEFATQNILDQLHVTSGTIVTDGVSVTINSLMLTARNTIAQVTGNWSAETESGHIRFAWSGSEPELIPAHEGDFEAQLHLPVIGRKSVSATMRVTAETLHGDVDSHLAFDASGREWTRMRGSLRADRLHWADEEDFLDLAGLTAHVEADWPSISLSRLQLPGAHFRGRGAWHVENQTWSFSANAREWEIPGRLGEVETGSIDLDLAVDGTIRRINLERLRLVHDEMTLKAIGQYVPADEVPLNVHAEVCTPLRAMNNLPVSGNACLIMRARGRLEPVDVSLDGSLHLAEFMANGRAIDPIDAQWAGRLSENRFALRTATFDLFGGQWLAAGDYDFQRRDVRFELRGESTSVAQLAELAGLPLDLDGIADANVELTLLDLDVDRLLVEGDWSVRDMRASADDERFAPGFGSGVGGDSGGAQGEGRITVRGRLVHLHDMALSHNSGMLTGQARMHLDEPNHAWIDVYCKNWTISLPDQMEITGILNGALNLELDLAPAASGLEAYGDLNARLEVMLRGDSIGRFNLLGSVERRTVVLDRLSGEFFDGSADGRGHLVLSRKGWQDSELDLTWSDIDLSRLAAHWAFAEPLSGISSGSLRVEQANDRRAPEPMHLHLDAQLIDGWYGPLQIEALDLRGYFGPARILLDPAIIDAAQGRTQLWARMRLHEAEPHLHVQAEYGGLNLEQIAHLLEITDEPMPGRVAGSISVGGYLAVGTNAPLSLHRMFGRAHAELTESELAALPGFRRLYDLLRLDFRPEEPLGYGTVDIRLEGDAVELSPLTYFNRGTDIISRMRIENIWAGRESPIVGLAAGAVRPLKDFDLPLLGNLDRLIGAVQTGAGSVRISGTLEAPESEVVPFAEAFAALGRIIRGMPQE